MEDLQLSDIPEFPDYVTVAQAARILGISTVSVYYKIYTQRSLRDVFRVGDFEDRPFLLLNKQEVIKVAEQERQPVEQTPEALLNAWNRRVKEWARHNADVDPATIRERGRPRQELVDRYLAAHPEDPRPI